MYFLYAPLANSDRALDGWKEGDELINRGASLIVFSFFLRKPSLYVYCEIQIEKKRYLQIEGWG